MIEYKDILDYPGYKIGNNGTILSEKNKKGYINTFPNPEGYHFAYLYRDNKRHTVAVHRLVAQYFVPNPNNYNCVNHKDECKDNNNFTNLEWCTRSYNRKYGTCEEKRFNTLAPRFSIEQYDLDGNYIRTWRSCNEAARYLGHKHGSHIGNCILGRKKTAYGFLWKKTNNNQIINGWGENL